MLSYQLLELRQPQLFVFSWSLAGIATTGPPTVLILHLVSFSV